MSDDGLIETRELARLLGVSPSRVSALSKNRRYGPVRPQRGRRAALWSPDAVVRLKPGKPGKPRKERIAP